MLLGQDLGGCHQGRLVAPVGCGGDCVQTHNGLAAPHVALQQPHHGAGRRHVGQNIADGALLSFGQYEGQRRP